MSDSRKIIVTETEYDHEAHRDKVLSCGHSMIDQEGVDRINVIWDRARPGPVTTFEWQTKYALKYTRKEPIPGLIVTFSGNWQECSLGDSYCIDRDGFWQRGPAGSGKANFLTIAGNAYRGVYPIVGIWHVPTRSYLPAYVEPLALEQGGSVDYQPGPYSRAWYASNHYQRSQFIQRGESERDAATIDTLVPNPRTHRFVWELTFEPDTGKWVDLLES